MPTTGTAKTLGTQSHTIDGGVSAGVHFNVLGGLSLRVRLGGQMILEPRAARRRREAAVGPHRRHDHRRSGSAAPALFTLGGHPFGVALFGGGAGAGAARADRRPRGRRAVDDVRRLLRRRAVVHADAAEPWSSTRGSSRSRRPTRTSSWPRTTPACRAATTRSPSPIAARRSTSSRSALGFYY